MEGVDVMGGAGAGGIVLKGGLGLGVLSFTLDGFQGRGSLYFPNDTLNYQKL